MHTASNKEFAIKIKLLFELLLNNFSNRESLSTLILIKHNSSKTLYTLLLIEENNIFNKLFIVSIITWEILVVFVIVSCKNTPPNKLSKKLFLYNSKKYILRI